MQAINLLDAWLLMGDTELSHTSVPLIHPIKKVLKHHATQSFILLFSSFFTRVSYKDPKLVYFKSIEMKQQQAY